LTESLSQQDGGFSFSSRDYSGSFPTRVLAATLKHVGGEFQRRLGLFQVVGGLLLDSIRNHFSRTQLLRLLPLTTALTEFSYSVKEFASALENRPVFDEIRNALVEGWPDVQNPENSHRMDHVPAEFRNQMLNAIVRDMDLLYESYRRDAEKIQNEIDSMFENIQQIQNAAKIDFDATRTRLMEINLRLTIITITLATATLLTSIFGMNLHSGLESDPAAFALVLGVGVLISLAVYGLFYVAWLKPLFRIAKQPAIHALSGDVFEFYQRANSAEYLANLSKMTEEDWEKALSSAVGKPISGGEKEVLRRNFSEEVTNMPEEWYDSK